jgi:DNA-binding SARP family transcriptional activator
VRYRIKYRILGPLKVDHLVDHPVLRRTMPRALLALLLLRANKVVSENDIHRALHEVAESPPPRLWEMDMASIRSYFTRLYEAFEEDVSQLREALGKDVLVVLPLRVEPDELLYRLTGKALPPRGFMLRIDPDELDLAIFERLVAKARGAFTATRAERLHSALALWRGPVLAEFDFAAPERARLERLRHAVLRGRIDADLELGRHSELIDDLEALNADHEGLGLDFVERLMIALYRTGRKADALAAYRDACRVLRDELGLEPSAKLDELARAIREDDAR